MSKIAFITGITGQDGSYLARFLLKKGYEVHGMKRRTSLINTDRVDDLYEKSISTHQKFFLHYGDLSDTANIVKLVKDISPDEIYNLGAQSHVAVSFETAEYTSNINGLGALRVLESIRMLGLEKKTRFYQASSSELFGNSGSKFQNESTTFYPRSPYAASKLFAYWITINYREAYNIFACNGILFNHESPLRGETFVSRKITLALARINKGLQDCLLLGNLDAKRDWGHAEEYVEMQWLMLQQKVPKDYVIATGKQSSVREFVEIAQNHIGNKIVWKGKGVNEKGYDSKTNKCIVAVSEKYYRPTEVDSLLGDASKANSELGWKPDISLEDLAKEMIMSDLLIAEKEALIKKHELNQ